MIKPYSCKKEKRSIYNPFPKYEIYLNNEIFNETMRFSDFFVAKEIVRMLNEAFEIGKLQGIIDEKRNNKQQENVRN